MEQGLSTQQLVSNLIRVGHKSLEPYKIDGLRIVKEDPNLFAHLIAWNQANGEIRDSKVALPIISLRGESGDSKIYYENAVAHLLMLDPRNLVRAVRFHREIGDGVKEGAGYLLRKNISEYLRIRESNQGWWDKTVLQHRASMKTLYALYHIKPSQRAQKILFEKEYPMKSVFFALKSLSQMNSTEAAGTILNFKIPFIIAIGALGGAKKNTDVILALIESMSGAELITNSKMLSKLGVMDNPVLKTAYEKGMQKAQKDTKVSSMKADRAKQFVGDSKIKAKLEKLQETKIDDLKGMEGDWLVLGDMSGSMSQSIEKAKEISAFIARATKGKVWLVFFNTRPVMYDVSGKTYEEVKKQTSGVRASGSTSIGCGLELMLGKGLIANGVVIVSDGGENTNPYYANVIKQYEKKFDFMPNTYLLHLDGDGDALTRSMKDLPYETFNVNDIDFYGLPSLLKILKTSRYTLIDEIMQTKLLTIKEVLNA
jgi:hypothetical protein